MKYIDAEKLIAEIDRRLMSVNLEELGNNGSHRIWAYNDVKEIVSSLQQEQPEVDFEKFAEKIKTFQGRYDHPEIVSINSAMAFMVRMFCQYPNTARLWYECQKQQWINEIRNKHERNI